MSFGDTVRVRTTEVTVKGRLAELVGTIHGETTPSVTGVEVIGALETDYAINVYFDDRGSAAWFDPRLLEFVDHGAGMQITVDGVAKAMVRSADGTWVEVPAAGATGKVRPWWKFW
jgi:hypothetical protein